MKHTHTPGPLKEVGTGSGNVLRRHPDAWALYLGHEPTPGKPRFVAAVFCNTDSVSAEEGKANMRLFAQADEMYTLLRSIAVAYAPEHGDMLSEKFVTRVREIVAAVEGA